MSTLFKSPPSFLAELKIVDFDSSNSVKSISFLPTSTGSRRVSLIFGGSAGGEWCRPAARVEGMASSAVDGRDERIDRISSSIRLIPDFPKPGILFQDITTLLLDPKAFKDSIDLFVERYKDKNINVVAGVEARGFIFGPPIALAIGAKFVPMRKPRKLPGPVISEEYSLEYGTDTMEMHVGAVEPGERAIIVDDLIATGGTLGAAIRLLERVGVNVVECACLIELAGLKDSNNSVESEAAYHADFLNTMADAFVVPTFPDDVMEEILQLKAVPPSSHGEMMHCKRMHGEDKDCLAHRNSVKKARMSGDQSAQRNNEIPMLKWYKKGVHTQSDEEEASTSMEDDSNNNPSESKGSSMHEKGKASRGSATDLQSLYARRRRERINKRLRILQGLVPNGTKVDISTMLEEAVHYVKFLQLQIKLLSSDDLWMYAPIAYNGMDIGMYQKLVPNLS